MKKRKQHRQPLSTQAIERLQFIQQLTGDQRFVRAMQTIRSCRKMRCYSHSGLGFHNPWFAHLLAVCPENGVNKVVSDHIKAHQPKYLDAAYNRTDFLEERRVVLQKWADFVTGAL